MRRAATTGKRSERAPVTEEDESSAERLVASTQGTGPKDRIET